MDEPALDNSIPPLPKTLEGCITSAEASSRFGISKDSASRLCRKGKVAGFFVGREWFINEQSLRAYLDLAKARRNSLNRALSESLRSEYKKNLPTPSTAALSSPVEAPALSASQPKKQFLFLRSFFTIVLVCAAASALLVPQPAISASVPPTILSYQGRLTDSGGNLLGSSSGSTYYFKFSIWDSPTVEQGNRVWPTSAPTSLSASVKQGVFTVNIGDTANGYPTPLTLNFSNYSALYLQVEVSSDNTTFETLSPRQQLNSSPYAQVSSAIVGTTTRSAFGTTTPIGNSFVTVQATSSSIVPLTIAGASGQSANLFQIENDLLQNLFSISSSGAVTLNNASTTEFSSYGPSYFGATATSSFATNGALTLASALTVANGGTGATSFTSGNLLYGSGSGALQSVATSSFAVGSGLTVSSGTLGAQVGGSAATIALAAIGANSVLGNSSGSSGTPSALATSSLFAAGAAGNVLTYTSAGTWVPSATTTFSCSSGVSCSPSGNQESFTNTGVTSISGTANQITASGSTGAITLSLPSLLLLTNASTTEFSSYGPSYFGATATSSFNSAGALTLASALTVGNGGTGGTSFTSSNLLYGAGSGALQNVATTSLAASSEFSYSGTLGALVGGAGGTLSLATNGTALSKLAQQNANSVCGNNTGATANITCFATSTLGVALSDTTGTLAVSRGGTGDTTFTASNLLYGNGTNALSSVATTSVSAGTGVTFSGTAGALVGGTALTINTPWTISGNNIYNNNNSGVGSVGVGSSSPYATLSVFAGGDYGSHAASTVFAVGSTTAGTAPAPSLPSSQAATWAFPPPLPPPRSPP